MFCAFSYTHSVIYPSSNLLSDIYTVNMHCRRKHEAAAELTKLQVLQFTKQIFRPITGRTLCWGEYKPTEEKGKYSIVQWD